VKTLSRSWEKDESQLGCPGPSGKREKNHPVFGQENMDKSGKMIGHGFVIGSEILPGLADNWS